MLYGMNFFRIAGDVLHTLSKCILIFAIHRNKSAEGVSLITQVFYALVFCTRYLNIFHESPADNYWNFVLKIFYISSSFWIVFIMMRLYNRTREREKAWKIGAWSLGGSLILAPIVTFIFRKAGERGPLEMLRVFSLVFESICVLPQLLLLRQTTVPTVIDSYYLLALGLYRLFYVFNWIEREIDDKWKPKPVDVIFGVIQTLLYIDFAWVYYTRQRVKLRGGGIVDGDDLRQSWVLRRIFGKPAADEDDEEAGPVRGRAVPQRNGSSRWGTKGISVSADHDVMAHESERARLADGFEDESDAQMRDPDELARGLDDDSDDEAAVPPRKDSSGVVPGVRGGEEWRDSGRK